MSKRLTNNEQAAPKRNPKALSVVTGGPGDDLATIVAKSITRPSVQAAATIQEFADRKCETGLTVDALANELQRQCNIAPGGDLRRDEGMLAAQAHTLDVVFNSLARRAAGQEYLGHYETFMRLALKAQAQCRATLEALAEIKNPRPVAFVHQANIAAGPQQVNNGTGQGMPESRAGNSENPPSKLLEADNGERLDTRATSIASAANQAMETVGAIDRAANPGG